MKKKPYYIYQELCDKIELDSKNIQELKEIIKEKNEEVKFLKDLIKKSDITVNRLIDLLIKTQGLTSQQRKYINEIIANKMEGENDD